MYFLGRVFLYTPFLYILMGILVGSNSSRSGTTKLLLFKEFFFFSFHYQKRYLPIKHSIMIKHSITRLICHFTVEKYELKDIKIKPRERSESYIYYNFGGDS